MTVGELKALLDGLSENRKIKLYSEYEGKKVDVTATLAVGNSFILIAD